MLSERSLSDHQGIADSLPIYEDTPPDEDNTRASSELHQAVLNDDVDYVQSRSVAELIPYINHPTSEGVTPLMDATSKRMVVALVAKGADIALLTQDTEGNRSSALLEMCGNGHDEAVEALLEGLPDDAQRRALINTAIDDITPLAMAASSGHPTLVRYFLAHGADASVRGDNDGLTAEELTRQYRERLLWECQHNLDSEQNQARRQVITNLEAVLRAFRAHRSSSRCSQCLTHVLSFFPCVRALSSCFSNPSNTHQLSETVEVDEIRQALAPPTPP